MNLHNNENFKHIIEEISGSKKTSSAIVEKDYFVTLFLKRLVEKDSDFFLKVVHLYLNFIKLLIVFLRISDKIRKSINKTVQSVAMDLGFNIKNLDEIRS